jgi:hypothetical protein
MFRNSLIEEYILTVFVPNHDLHDFSSQHAWISELIVTSDHLDKFHIH